MLSVIASARLHNTYFDVRKHGFAGNNGVSVISLQAKNATELSSGISGVDFVKGEFDVVAALHFGDVQAKIAVKEFDGLLHLLFLA